MRINYNAPVTLTFALAATVVFIADWMSGGKIAPAMFSTPASVADFLGSFRYVSYVLGHRDGAHLTGNLMLLLLLGPGIEEKYRPSTFAITIVATALATSILNALLFSTGIMGASGIVFMCIVMSSLTNVRRGEIPLTFILVTALFLGREVFDAIHNDATSQFAHIIGGVCGGFFGFVFAKETPRTP